MQEGFSRVGRHTLRYERGSIFPLLALIIALLVVLSFALGIDVPITQSVASNGQDALDHAATAALESGVTYAGAVNAASRSLLTSLRKQQSMFTQRDPFVRVVVPRPGNSFLSYQCDDLNHCAALTTPISADPILSGLTSVFNRFDTLPVDDYKNSVIVAARYQPRRFLPSVSGQAPTDLVSVSMLQTAMTYILIDPAFSIEGNYSFIWGSDPCGVPDPLRWPLAHPAGDALGAAWSASPGQLLLTPRAALPRSNQSSDVCIAMYHGGQCDSLPFVEYKTGIVHLIDRLSRSSAYNSTTLVGLTGYRVLPDFVFNVSDLDPRYGGINEPLVPIHPKFEGAATGSPCTDTVARHFPDSGPAFPLQIHGGAENVGLHSRKLSAFEGFVNTAVTALNSNRTRDCGTPSTAIAGTGLNRWELCSCRAFYVDGGGAPTDGLLADDLLPTDDLSFNHVSSGLRRRDSGVGNWCDDVQTGPEDTQVDLTASGQGAGESTRNLVSNLAIRMDDNYFFISDAPGLYNNWWVQPFPGVTARTGWRDASDSIFAAGQAVDRAWNEYANDPGFSRRSIPESGRSIVYFGFGPWSRTTELGMADIYGGNYYVARLLLREQFRRSLVDTVCRRRIQFIAGLLPMSDFDLLLSTESLQMVQQLQLIYEAQKTGATLNAADTPDIWEAECFDSARPIAPAHLFLYDWKAAQFASASPAQSKLAAATAFRAEIPSLITRLLSRYERRI